MSTATSRPASVRPDAEPEERVTEVVLEAAPAGGHPRLGLRSGVLVPRVLASGPHSARVALVAGTATLLAGDSVRLRVEVGPGLRLDLVDIAGTVAYNGRGGRPSGWHVEVHVAEGAALRWRGEPLVVADGAEVLRTLSLDVEQGGVALIRDLVVLGRHGERGGSLRCRTRARHGGVPVLAEDLDLGGGPDALRALPGVLGDSHVVESVLCVGRVPSAGVDVTAGLPATILDLAGEGRVARWLGAAAHGSPLDRLWDEWARGVAPDA